MCLINFKFPKQYFIILKNNVGRKIGLLATFRSNLSNHDDTIPQDKKPLFLSLGGNYYSVDVSGFQPVGQAP